jgi:hypothetical protein
MCFGFGARRLSSSERTQRRVVAFSDVKFGLRSGSL